jgi:hypothetical protein
MVDEKVSPTCAIPILYARTDSSVVQSFVLYDGTDSTKFYEKRFC